MIGQEFRKAREAVGVSISALARMIAFSESHMRSIENGNRAITLETAEAYDRALSMGGLLVDVFLAAENGDDVRRRAALGLLGAITGFSVTPQVILESLREDLLSALGSEDWPDIASEYGQRFMTDSPEVFKGNLTGELLVLRQSLISTDSLATRLAAPRLMTLYGMITANTGDAATASRWYRAARLAADRTSDIRLQQWVRGREAFRRGYEGATPNEVLAIASSIEDVEAKLAAAQAYARLGQDSQSRVALDDARRCHDMADQSETTIYAMPPWRMALSTAYVYALLGDVARCDAELAAVVPPLTVQRWQAQLEMQRAVAYGRSGDVRSAIEISESVIRATLPGQRSIVLKQMHKEVKQCAQASERNDTESC